ncbi:dCMP deaminase [Malassezia yamatoensis]|uniref:mRNA guanylyltransferase n=1 Tax=Malassezia yamatoensis TaxID=253288 RepID=A0AAJ5YV73_9BASI|nr:dCMP deaminase [Malassezia yamatoensis]
MTDDSFWVCEKSDGQRVLVLIVVPPATGQQEVFLIDRKNNYYYVNNLVFPHHESKLDPMGRPTRLRTDTLLDGELVIDSIAPGQTKMRLLLFDCLVIDGENMMRKELGRRYGRLRTNLLPPYRNYLKADRMAQFVAPFEVQVKGMDLAYGIEAVLEALKNHVQHESDGLIFTNYQTGYTCGTDQNILKWKPPQDNTIDFKLQLFFPPDFDRNPQGSVCDLTAKPFFQLLQHVKNDEHEEFDYLDMSEEEWARWKQSGVQLDDAIVECAWRPRQGGLHGEFTWHITRIRDDKQTANHKSTVSRILKSIQDGVEQEELLELAPRIREAWKTHDRIKERDRINASTQGIRTDCRYKRGPKPPMRRGGMPNLIRR